MRFPTPQRGGERPTALAACAAMLVTLCVLHVAVFDRKPDYDDAYFAAALDHQTLGAFLLERYMRWSGRLPIDAFAALLLDHLWIWRIVNVAMVVWLCASAARLGFGRRLGPFAGTGCAFALLWCMPSPVLRDAAWWVSGSFNYLWPTAAGLAAMVPLFDRRTRGPWAWAGIVLAGGFAAYHEQVALAMLGIGLPRVAWLWRTKRLGRGEVVLMVSILVNAAINFGAPGIQHRYVVEIGNFYPTFDQLTLWDKGVLGLEVLAKLARSSNVLLVLSCGALVALSLRATMPRGARIGVLAACALLVVAVIAPKLLPPVLVACALVGLVAGIGLVVQEDDRREAVWRAWTLAVGFGTLAAMAMSPTVHGSGSRTSFVACIALLIATCRLLVEVRARFGQRAFAWTMGAACVVALLRVFEEVAKAA
ncbi:DUF6056 family protein [Lysobacter sp. A6]|uniref:DUF6056 family protein n=1 Tax=Noviluteimonas lactosilytica TaxID=2888523 RepID=A0ABS8JDR2_9GAMM|nr:DUF6056 family protein [Lysobacter lactosilyticus]MCC8361746.1 DUF6056 family protein [Lysobacter lactosilyticus]